MEDRLRTQCYDSPRNRASGRPWAQKIKAAIVSGHLARALYVSEWMRSPSGLQEKCPTSQRQPSLGEPDPILSISRPESHCPGTPDIYKIRVMLVLIRPVAARGEGAIGPCTHGEVCYLGSNLWVNFTDGEGKARRSKSACSVHLCIWRQMHWGEVQGCLPEPFFLREGTVFFCAGSCTVHATTST